MHSGLEQCTIYTVEYSDDSPTYTQSKFWAVSRLQLLTLQIQHAIVLQHDRTVLSGTSIYWWSRVHPTAWILPQRGAGGATAQQPKLYRRSSQHPLKTVSKPSQNRIHTVWNGDQNLTMCNKIIDSSELGVHVILKNLYNCMYRPITNMRLLIDWYTVY